jgi:uncharacterized protein YuzE
MACGMLQRGEHQGWLRAYRIHHTKTDTNAKGMASAALSSKDLQKIVGAVEGLLTVPARRFWVDYDDEADVLYLSFRKPQKATDSELRGDGVIVRKRGKEIVGLTILDASKR